ncbi:TonB-dependent receptor [Prosthecochloris sp. N3]|uniref:TonB-dependent receptor n=1 Tax=Prosthecochloris ethylica TaxID=2743976 RepID=A0ABR9XU13_9CHLB|nr:TonB-dependent receptor [Prosthecochloris ethylica]MBF0587121.1 TonB-dependent receptor [Prosthecochloris ethylica]MBF0637423.1 TonB-dependent receptor [Prosthecochloris ethylica]NUK48063.1 TonB-dependent receptor [Prosthecochloris ethylica]
MKKKRFLVFLAAGLLASGVVKAEDVADSTEVKNYFGNEVVVTATKTLNSVSDAGGSSVTVITEEEIERSGQQTVEEVIKGATGINVVSNGGIGANSSVFIRGADSKYTLLLVDGVPMNDPTGIGRAANFSHLTVDNIERIEIVRGPVSTLYGNAAAGAINVITKKGTGSPEVHMGAEGGSYGTWKVYGGARGAENGFDYSMNVSRLETDGFSSANADNDGIPHAGNTSEDDGYENTTGSVSLGYQFNENVRLEGAVRYTDSSVETDDWLWAYAGDRADADPAGLKENHTDTEQLSGRIALQANFQPVLSTVYYNFSDHRRERYNNEGDFTGFSDGELYEVGIQQDVSVSEHNVFSAGLSYSFETYQDDALSADAGMLSFFAQDQWEINGLKLVGVIRYDDHDTFGDRTTWRVAPSYKVDETTLKASYGTGFRVPGLYELYGPSVFYGGIEYPVGNPDLEPETSKGWDIGIEQKIADRIRSGVTYFRTDFEDQIIYGNGYEQADGTTEIQGVETFIEWAASDEVFLAADYTWTETEDPDGNELERRPRHKFGLTGSWDVTDKARLAANMQWVGDRKASSRSKDKDGNPVGELDSYVLVNLTGSYQVTENIELYGRVDNLLDEFYEEAWSYATPGLSAYGGIRLTY